MAALGSDKPCKGSTYLQWAASHRWHGWASDTTLFSNAPPHRAKRGPFLIIHGCLLYFGKLTVFLPQPLPLPMPLPPPQLWTTQTSGFSLNTAPTWPYALLQLSHLRLHGHSLCFHPSPGLPWHLARPCLFTDGLPLHHRLLLSLFFKELCPSAKEGKACGALGNKSGGRKLNLSHHGNAQRPHFEFSLVQKEEGALAS